MSSPAPRTGPPRDGSGSRVTAVPVPQLRRRGSALGLTKRIYIGFSSDGVEIVATYTSRREVDEFRQPDEIVSGPWMRVPRAARARVKARGKT